MSGREHISHDPAVHRFSTEVEGSRAELDYTLADGVMTITHTRVPPPIGGRGVAAQLMEAALSAARAAGWSVIPACSYAKSYLEKHPQGPKDPRAADKQHVDELLDEASTNPSPRAIRRPWAGAASREASGALRARPAGRACRSRALLPPSKYLPSWRVYGVIGSRNSAPVRGMIHGDTLRNQIFLIISIKFPARPYSDAARVGRPAGLKSGFPPSD